MDSSSSTTASHDPSSSQLEFKWKEVMCALGNMPLKYVGFGDYILVMNDRIDATIEEDPYLALDLWFNMKTGKVISRIWGQTVACEKVADVSQFVQTCTAHFRGRPCVGYPDIDDDQRLQDFVVSQTPIPRKIATTCQKVMDPDTNIKIMSCSECLKLRQPPMKDEMSDPEQTFDFEQILVTEEQENGLQRGDAISPSDENQTENHGRGAEQDVVAVVARDKRRKCEGQFACDTADCGYRTKKKWNLQTHCRKLSHRSSYLRLDTSQSEESHPESGNEKRIYRPCNIRRKNEGEYACDTTDCGYRTKKKWSLQEHCRQLSHISLFIPNQTAPMESPQGEIRWRNNEGKFACESAECGYRTDNRSSLRDHCQRKSHQSSCLAQDKSPKAEQLNVKCEPCGKVFETRLGYDRHKDHDHEGGTMHMKCNVCGSVVNCNFFSHHMKTQHKMTGMFVRKCDWCQEELSTQSIKGHAMKQHFYGRFLCEICTFRGDFARDLVNHMNQDHEEVSSAKCPICEGEHPLENIESHYERCVKLKMRKRQLQSDKCEQVCDTCGKTITTKSGYRQHIQSHLRKGASKEEEESSEIANLYHYCDQCGKRFTKPYLLKMHIKSVHENVQYPCSSCPLIFADYFKLNRHKLQVHSTDEKYQCKYCGKRFGDVTTRKLHERVHEDPKFQCGYCEKKLKSKEALESHERYHTGERPFKCSICGTGFTGNERLLQHMSGAHKITGPKGRKAGWRKGKEKLKV